MHCLILHFSLRDESCFVSSFTTKVVRSGAVWYIIKRTIMNIYYMRHLQDDFANKIEKLLRWHDNRFEVNWHPKPTLVLRWISMFFLFGALPIDTLRIKHTKKLKEMSDGIFDKIFTRFTNILYSQKGAAHTNGSRKEVLSQSGSTSCRRHNRRNL